MSDRQTEQERDAAVIARRPQRYADLRAITELRSFSPEETVLLVRVANAGADLIQAQHRDRVRLTAEVERLRAVIDDAAAFLSGEAKQLSIESEQGWDDTAAVEYRAEADKLRAALGTEGRE